MLERKRLAKAISIPIFLAILLFVGSNVVFACSCKEPENVQSEYSKADAVFIGKVVGLEKLESGYNYRVRFKVIKSYKGVATEQLEIFSTLSEIGCDYSFEKNEEYLVYSHYILGGDARVSSCGRTKKLLEAKEDLEVLNGIITNSKIKE
mgnify:CR=1 FL=1